MNVSENYKNIIAKEFREVVEKMKETKDLSEKMYFFSATYGVVSRVFNLDFDPVLVFVHLILNAAYDTINGRLMALKGRQDEVVQIPENLFDSLQKAVERLAENIETGNKNELFKNLQKIANLSFATTGNGYYLFKKGMLKI
jgi:hypothetical protein